MNINETYEKVLNYFSAYYNVDRENAPAPFDAKAVFTARDSQYFLMKSAKISESDAHETAYFRCVETLSCEELQHMIDISWEDGLQGLVPYYGHRCTDVTLFVLADHIDEAVFDKVKKITLYRSYRFRFFGSSTLRLVAVELSTGRYALNRHGHTLKKLIRNIVS